MVRNVDRAAPEVARLAKQFPASPEIQVLVGSVAAMKGELAAARAAFQQALTTDPKSFPALAGLIGVEVGSGKPAEARARLSAGLAKDPLNPSLLELAGRTYIALGDAKAAEQHLRKLIEVQPANLAAYGELGQLYLSQGRLDESRAELEKYVARQPSAVGAQTLIGITLQLQNKMDEAQKKYERTLEIDSKAAVAANNLAWMYAEKNTNLDVALDLAKSAKSQMPNQAEVDDTLGWVYLKKGLASLAVSSFRQSVSRDANNPAYSYHLGLALLKNGETSNAKDAFQKALALKKPFEGSAEARRILAAMN
jgi:tetratricopeptide (TPR) repeat protein